MPRSKSRNSRSGGQETDNGKIRELREEDFKNSRTVSGMGRRQTPSRTTSSRTTASRSATSRSASSRTTSSRNATSRSRSQAPAPDSLDSFYVDEEEDVVERSSSSRSSRGRAKGKQNVTIGRRTGKTIIKKETNKPKTTFAMPLPKRREINFSIVACVLILMFVGLIMVTSSSYYYAYNTWGDSMYFFKRQGLWTVLGLAAMIVSTRIPLRWYKTTAKAIYGLALFLSLLVLVVGTTTNGSTRWLNIGGMSFQPSELTKLAVIIFLSEQVVERQSEIRTRGCFALLFFEVLVPTGLVATQNLSSAVIILVVGLMIMFIGGCRLRYFFTMVLPLVALGMFVLAMPLLFDVNKMPSLVQKVLSPVLYRTERIEAWLDPFANARGSGYQTIQSLYAIGSGGFFGRGLGQSIQKLGYIPEAYNDIIFAIICEELGFFGAMMIVLLFVLFAWNGVQVSFFAPNTFMSLIAAGITGQIALQAILNIGVNTNMIPPTGVTLPFISYGGSSMLFLMWSVGMLLDISAFSYRAEKKSVPDSAADGAAAENAT